ncbi:hypothetical protein LguiA_030814 [Lonicera macranthoides]
MTYPIMYVYWVVIFWPPEMTSPLSQRRQNITQSCIHIDNFDPKHASYKVQQQFISQEQSMR